MKLSTCTVLLNMLTCASLCMPTRLQAATPSATKPVEAAVPKVTLSPAALGKKQSKQQGHVNEISLFVTSKDGYLALSGDDEENNYIWDMKSGGKFVREIGKPEAARIRVVAAAFSPDSSQLLWARNGKIMPVLWDVESGRRIGVLSSKEKGHAANIVSVAFSPDGRFMASGDSQGVVVIWNRADRSVLKRIKAHSGDARFLLFVNGRNELVTASPDGSIKIWSVSAAEQGATLLEPSEYAVTALTSSADGQFVYAALGDMTVKGWSVAMRSLRGTLDFNNRLINSIALSPDGDYMAVAEEDQSVMLWNIRESKVAWRTDLDNSVTQVQFATDGKRLITSGGDNQIRIWNVATGSLVKNFGGSEEAQ